MANQPRQPSYFAHSINLYVFGGMSCMAAACVTNPIDVLKTRLQIQGELSNAKRMSLWSTTLQMYNTEGFRGFYKGLAASLLREGSYSTLRMGGYESIKTYLLEWSRQDELNLSLKILAGATSGALGAGIANPTDLIKVRMQASKGVRYSGVSDAFFTIIRQEGWRGLYKGVGPTTQRACFLTASQLPSYDHFKHIVLRRGWMDEGRPLHFLASMVAGLACAITTSPVDNIKTRIMNQPVDARGVGVSYKSSMDCLAKTIRAEGVVGLYKGFLPQWLRIGPHTIVTFIFLEQLRRLAGMAPV